jgi:hypothetical protein
VFDHEEADGPEALDVAAADAGRFGSYKELIKMDRYRYQHPRRSGQNVSQ